MNTNYGSFFNRLNLFTNSINSISKNPNQLILDNKISLIAVGIGLGVIGGMYAYNKLSKYNNQLTLNDNSGNILLFNNKLVKTLNSQVKQIEVLDQNYQGPLGIVRCGAHALKNALVGLGLIIPGLQINENWFSRQDVFEDLLNFIYDHNPGIDRNDFENADLSISVLQDAIHILKETDPSLISENLRQFREVCMQCPHLLSSFNVISDFDLIQSFGPLAIDSILNLFEISQSQGPLIHAFIIGDTRAQHWVTILLEKEESGKLNWFGCNSWMNESGNLINLVDYLTQIIQNPEEKIKAMYKEAIDEAIQHDITYFNRDGILQLDPDVPGKSLKIMELDIENAIKAFDLMARMGWLEGDKLQDVEIKEYVKNLQLFSHYVSLNQDPVNCPATEEQKRQLREIGAKLLEIL